ncbi:unnamed protein product [Porites lobata]|uniref:Uncharacterized protein n=1 Tax=Porites lobata TaxID=104759 RepID=A0ABN8QEH3_9CNID|nr:unnamed protein product [Porites lobata]
MATRPDEYITLDGRVTNNIPEGYHEIVLMYRNKRIDLRSVHYKCKANMSIPHKMINNNMNIGPIWVLLLFQLLQIPMPKKSVERQEQYDREIKMRSSQDYQKKRKNTNEKNMKKHEKEKECMKSLKAVSVTTSYCGTAGSESEESGDSENSEDELPEPDNYISNLTDSSGDDESSDEVTDSPSPLYFLNDCEGTGGSVYEDHVVEIAAVLQPLAGNVETNIPSTFQSVINTSKRRKYFPVLIAHNGFVYDFPLLFAEVDRRYPC